MPGRQVHRVRAHVVGAQVVVGWFGVEHRPVPLDALRGVAGLAPHLCWGFLVLQHGRQVGVLVLQRGPAQLTLAKVGLAMLRAPLRRRRAVRGDHRVRVGYRRDQFGLPHLQPRELDVEFADTVGPAVGCHRRKRAAVAHRRELATELREAAVDLGQRQPGVVGLGRAGV